MNFDVNIFYTNMLEQIVLKKTLDMGRNIYTNKKMTFSF